MFLRELAAVKAKKQPKQIDDLTVNSPIFDTMDFFGSTHGLQHAYQELVSVTGGSLVGVDEPLPSADLTTKLNWKELGILGFNVEAGIDTVKTIAGDFPSYLAMKVPGITRKTSMDAEKSLIYDVLRLFAKKTSKLVSAYAGASGTDHYTLLAVRWEEGALCGLYDENGFGQGAMLETIYLSGGNPYKNSAGKTVYGADFKSYLGFLTASEKNIAGIVNINASHKPTAAMIDDMLDECYAGTNGKTFIYGHPKALRMLSDIKGSAIQMSVNEKEYSRSLAKWDGIELVPSFNFDKGTEAAVSLS
ncbi:MAG: hypothetical protein II903_09415 [Spirochaetales bacterium]|nr:hypothetical protein [Spirochaetales bacterium]